MEPTFVKGWSRKAGIHFYLKEYHKALDAYNTILKLEPAPQPPCPPPWPHEV